MYKLISLNPLTLLIFLDLLPFPLNPAPTGLIIICDEDVCKFAEDIVGGYNL